MSVGERLREAREAAGLSLEDIATSTRIPTRHLESIEASDFTRLPAPTYTVGFAKNFAGAVGLDRAEIGEQLRAEMGGTRPISTTAEVFEPADPARAMPKWLIFGAIGGIATSINDINQKAHVVSDAVAQQLQATNEISRNVQQASSETETVSKRIAAAADAAASSGNGAAQLRDEAISLAGDVDQLRELSGEFVTRIAKV